MYQAEKLKSYAQKCISKIFYENTKSYKMRNDFSDMTSGSSFRMISAFKMQMIKK